MRRCLIPLERVLAIDYGEASSKLVSFLSSNNNVIITYVGSYVSPAKYALLTLRSITKLNAYLFRPNELIYYVVPYDEGRELGIVVFAYPDGLSDLNILIDQVRFTGHDYLIIIPEDLPKVISYKVPRDNVVNLELGKELLRYWILATHLLVGNTAPKLCSRGGIRSDRLLREVKDVTSVINDLISHYEEDLIAISKFIREPVIVTATPTMWGVAEYLALSNDVRSLRLLVPTDQVGKYVSRVNNVLLINTEVEEYSLRGIRGLSLTAATTVKELKLRTDPLTAPIYGLVLARVIEYLASGGLHE